MVRKCEHHDCDTQPTFNIPTEKVGRFCKKHASSGMINIVEKRRCEHNDCDTRPNFNIPTEKVGRFCSIHALSGMIDVKSKRCEHNDCDTQPNFNIPSEKAGRFCKIHALPGMIDVKHKRCEHDGCDTLPNFNIPTETIGRFCSIHALPSMIDVKNKRCEHDGCGTQPHFNIPSEKVGRFCSIHALSGMIDVKHKRCEHYGCNTQPHFNIPSEKVGRFCSIHALPGMIDVMNKRCKTPMCDTQVSNPKYKGHCLFCFMHLFPNEPVARNYKTKETCVADHIKDSFPDYDVSFDRKVTCGCSARRPDIMFDFGQKVIIVEIDENQHENYESSCENKRIMQLSQDVDHRPIVFIRFNPDQYTNSIGQKVTSCWSINKQGICQVKKSKQTEWKQRLECLTSTIKNTIEEHIHKTISIFNLYYNET